jgi:hypothetical protein
MPGLIGTRRIGNRSQTQRRIGRRSSSGACALGPPGPRRSFLDVSASLHDSISTALARQQTEGKTGIPVGVPAFPAAMLRWCSDGPLHYCVSFAEMNVVMTGLVIVDPNCDTCVPAGRGFGI